MLKMTQANLCQLLRGVIEPLLLFIIADLPMHGYQIAKELERRSRGYFKLRGSTLYSALRRLEREGLVLSTWQQVAHKQWRRCYEITEKGRQILSQELIEWQRFYRGASSVIGDNSLISDTEAKE